METEHVALAPISCCILYSSISKKIMLCAWTHISWFCSYNWCDTLKTCLMHTKALCPYHRMDGTLPGDIRMQTKQSAVGWLGHTRECCFLQIRNWLHSIHVTDKHSQASYDTDRLVVVLPEFRKQDGQLHPFWQIWLKRRGMASLMFLGLDLHGHHSLLCGLLCLVFFFF